MKDKITWLAISRYKDDHTENFSYAEEFLLDFFKKIFPLNTFCRMVFDGIYDRHSNSNRDCNITYYKLIGTRRETKMLLDKVAKSNPLVNNAYDIHKFYPVISRPQYVSLNQPLTDSFNTKLQFLDGYHS